LLIDSKGFGARMATRGMDISKDLLALYREDRERLVLAVCMRKALEGVEKLLVQRNIRRIDAIGAAVTN
jgi:hypothetical protein